MNTMKIKLYKLSNLLINSFKNKDDLLGSAYDADSEGV